MSYQVVRLLNLTVLIQGPTSTSILYLVCNESTENLKMIAPKYTQHMGVYNLTLSAALWQTEFYLLRQPSATRVHEGEDARE